MHTLSYSDLASNLTCEREKESYWWRGIVSLVPDQSGRRERGHPPCAWERLPGGARPSTGTARHRYISLGEEERERRVRKAGEKRDDDDDDDDDDDKGGSFGRPADADVRSPARPWTA